MMRLEELALTLEDAVQHETDVKLHVGDDFFLEYDSHTFVSYRKFVQYAKDGKFYPTKNGISMTTSQFAELLSVLRNDVPEHYPEYKEFMTCLERHGDGNQMAVLGCPECCQGYNFKEDVHEHTPELDTDCIVCSKLVINSNSFRGCEEVDSQLPRHTS